MTKLAAHFIMEGLLPQVVLRSDPRWPACVEELRRLVTSPDPQLLGLDTEFFESAELRAFAVASGRDMPKKDAWDSWSTQLRLLQVGLPSGLAMVFDFGPRGFDWHTGVTPACVARLHPYACPIITADVDLEALGLDVPRQGDQRALVALDLAFAHRPPPGKKARCGSRFCLQYTWRRKRPD